MKIRVDCYSGYRGEETPRRFWLEETLIEIREVVDRWLDPGHRYFKVVDDDHSTYILRHDSEDNPACRKSFLMVTQEAAIIISSWPLGLSTIFHAYMNNVNSM